MAGKTTDDSLSMGAWNIPAIPAMLARYHLVVRLVADAAGEGVGCHFKLPSKFSFLLTNVWSILFLAISQYFSLISMPMN